MQRLRGVALDALSVVILGLRLIWRHWPWLLAIYLLGSAAHGGLIWFAVNVSKTQPFVAGLILPLAPIASMAALILMLRRLAPSLSHAAFVTQGTAVAGSGAGSPPASGEEPAYSAGGVLAVDPTSEMAPATATPSEGRFLSRAAAQLSLVVSMLVPFLTLYSTQGYLDEDRNVFVNAAGTDELLGNADIFYGGSANVVGRIFLVTGLASVVLLVVVTFLIRRIANRFQLASRHLILALAIGYVEVFWLFSVANILDAFKTGLWSWIQGRVVVVWFIEHFNLLIAALGELGRPLRAVADLLTSIVNSSTNVILIPLAWLVVGAIAYGRRIEVPTRPEVRAAGRLAVRMERVRARAELIPEPVRKVGRELVGDLRERFSDLADGLRMLAVAGLVPMLLFCLVFFLARYGEYLTAELFRVLIGAQDLHTGLATSPYVDVGSRAVYTILLITLVAAAIDRIITRDDQRPAPVGTDPGPGADPVAVPEARPSNEAGFGLGAPAPDLQRTQRGRDRRRRMLALTWGVPPTT